jgi:hypothetical protein
VRKILAALLLVATAACRATAPAAGAPTGSTGVTGTSAGVLDTGVGAADGPAAVDRFLGAARASDVQGMARVFGTAAGPIGEREPAADVEKRMRALQCYLAHDASRFLGASPGAGGKQVLLVELRQRELTRQTRFTVVPGPGRRWFVESFEINSLSDFCRP